MSIDVDLRQEAPDAVVRRPTSGSAHHRAPNQKISALPRSRADTLDAADAPGNHNAPASDESRHRHGEYRHRAG